MNIYFEPINLNVLDMFSKVKNNEHIETFIATKEMNVGDFLLLYVGNQKSEISSSVYAIARITTKVFILKDSPDDYCNNRRTVRALIYKTSFNKPIIDNSICKQIFNQFRSVHRVRELLKLEIVKSFL